MDGLDPVLKIFLLSLSYLCMLLIVRLLNIGKKKVLGNITNACPDCNASLNRIKRLKADKVINYLTYKIFELKRYACQECGWEGLRW